MYNNQPILSYKLRIALSKLTLFNNGSNSKNKWNTQESGDHVQAALDSNRMQGYMIKFLTITVFISVSLLSQAQNRLAEIEQFITNCEVLELDDYLCNRERNNSLQPRLINDQLDKLFLLSDSLSYDTALECLKHNNPKLRALGLISIYRFNNICDYKIYHGFLSDSGYCFKTNPYKGLKFLSNRPVNYNEPSDLTVREEISRATTYRVSDVAKKFLSFYPGVSQASRFDTCDSLSVNLRYLEYLLRKATGGISPLRESRKIYIDSLKAKIEKIDNDELRTIYKIYLSNWHKSKGPYSGVDLLYNDSELSRDFVKLKKETIKSLLSRRITIKDINLQQNNVPQESSWSYKSMCDWILLNVHLVFDKEDISFLLNRATFEIDSVKGGILKTASWYAACAKIDTINASKYIKSGIDIFKDNEYLYDRSFLYSQLWHLSDKKESKQFVDWFYEDYYTKEKGIYSYFMDSFDLILLREIVYDPRFSISIKNRDLLKIADYINIVSGKQLIAAEFTNNIGDEGFVMSRKAKKEMSVRVEKLKSEIRKQLE